MAVAGVGLDAGLSGGDQTEVVLDAAPLPIAIETSSSQPFAPVTAGPASAAVGAAPLPLVAEVTSPPPPPRAPTTGDRAARSGPRESGSSSARESSAPTQPGSGGGGGGGSRAAQVLALVNVEREQAGCGSLSRDGALESAAVAHSRDMAANDYFSHDSQDGRSFSDRVRAAGYSGGSIAENIAAGQSSAAAVVDSWMSSEGHRANILNCSYTDMGLGYATGGSYGSYWTQDLGG